jgi:translation initiation factor 3 subunit G
MTTRENSVKWGDVDGSDGEDLDDYQRSTVFVGPDEDGVTVVTYNDMNGKKITTTRKIQMEKKIVRKRRSVVQRRKWAKFGKVKGLPPGVEPQITTLEVPMSIIIRIRKRGEEEETQKKSIELKSDGCTHCGDPGHWFLKCPLRSIIMRQKTNAEAEAEQKRVDAERAANPNVYRAPGRRDGGGGRSDRNEENTVRVHNLPEETTEDDLRELFSRWHTTRIYLAKDIHRRVSRGFAFVSFERRSDAEDAIKKLHRFGYGHLLLHVEFSHNNRRAR